MKTSKNRKTSGINLCGTLCILNTYNSRFSSLKRHSTWIFRYLRADKIIRSNFYSIISSFFLTVFNSILSIMNDEMILTQPCNSTNMCRYVFSRTGEYDWKSIFWRVLLYPRLVCHNQSPFCSYSYGSHVLNVGAEELAAETKTIKWIFR